MPEKPNPRNIWKHIQLTPSCWFWKGSKTCNGYGQMSFAGKRHLAHRFVYELLEGKIPETADLDHLCRNRNCVNPAHLDYVSRRDNLLRGTLRNQNSDVTHCIRRHSFTVENTYLTKDNRRQCRICIKIRYKKNVEVNDLTR